MAASPSDFGSTIRRLRHGAGLSQEELAEHAGVSARAVSDMERGLRKRPRPETLRLLADALGLSNDERAMFYVAAHPDLESGTDRTMGRSPTGSSTILPPLRPLAQHPDELIGREEDLATIKSLFLDQQVRLITLTGPGGVGKTRLALEAARRLAPWFSEGVEFIDLSAVRAADQVAGAIARALGIREYGNRPVSDLLLEALGDTQRLLVLDNFEQVIDAASVVGELVTAAPRLQILITSRETLRIRDELEIPIRPFALPEQPMLGDIETHRANPAVALFVATAQTVRPGFTLSAENVPTVIEICRRLDGLPLAIELAAARLKHFPLELLLSRLQQRLPLLSGGPRDAPMRHQTLRDTIAWSYDLLAPVEQQLFRSLGVFAAGATFEAIEAVAPSTNMSDALFDVMTGLGSLVDKSLVVEREEAGGTPRFVLLDTIREFALQTLRETNELDQARAAHAHWHVVLVENQIASIDTESTSIMLDRLRNEHDNILEALAWSVRSGQAELAVRLSGALWFYWYIQGLWSTGILWIKTALALDGPVPVLPWAVAWNALGFLAHYQGDRTASAQALERGLEFARAADNAREIGTSLVFQGIAAEDTGDFETAERLLHEAQSYGRKAGYQALLGLAEMHLGVVWFGRNELNRAVACFVGLLENHDRLRLTTMQYQTLQHLGEVYCWQRALPAAAEAFEHAMALQKQFRIPDAGDFSSMDIAALAAALDLYPQAARLLGWSEQKRLELGAPPPVVPEKWLYDEANERARAHLG
ncbi:MAG TPA: helix-turn-helix domain-containing protein, partial [Thermomicrobiales bacterium]|nr:helix-turn-helix domain-containing protein [Thermomicrobiales bacterium]